MKKSEKRSPLDYAPGEIVHLVEPIPGHTPSYDDCPVCMELRRQGHTLHAVGPGGELEPIDPGPFQSIRVRLAADALTAPIMGEPADIEVPDDCLVGDFFQYLCFFVPQLLEAFPPDALHLRVNGRRPRPGQRLRAGDEVTLTSSRVPLLSLV